MNFTFIDDRDPTINYTGTWNQGSTGNDTVSSSIKVGDHFSVPFTGTAIGVYGTYNSSSAGVKTSYKIDGGQPTTVSSRVSQQDSYRQLFWQSTPVGIGPHTLVVSMVAVNSKAAGGEGTVWFDYFRVSHAVASPSVPKAASHAALIGGVIAGVVVLIAAGLLFLYLRRKRKYKSKLSSTPITPLPALIPATVAEPGPRLAASSGKHGRPNPNSGAPETMHTSAQSSYQPYETAASQSTSIADLKRQQQLVASSYEAGINRGNAQSTVPIQHVDSGMRELTPAAGPAELPPVYTAT
ncbi:Amidohydro-rel domain-containing protein [Mycena venus]|uniref:Amidohydro-rel domain-containing protein n=1 Tax=Mycena venus TaxID=2733690 RepID=A0A8H6XL83_9AGAR|nr:Amidohydro-rel domain-containing protein [Mycena venus]